MAKDKGKIGFGQKPAEEAAEDRKGIAQDFKAAMGRPAIYDTPEALFYAICQHFEDCERIGKAPTVNSLALALGFAQRNGLDRQAQRGAEFSNIVTRAKLAIAAAWEEVGQFAKSANFAQFALSRMKGAGYEDQGFELEAGTLKLKFGYAGEEEAEEAEELSGPDVGVEG